MYRSSLSLKGLEIFQLAAHSGSVQAVATDLGLSVSTVSHHLKRLEETLGADLLDHSRRPMILTSQGEQFLRHTDEALRQIRQGEAALAAGSLAQTRMLRLGLIEDFDSEIAPELAQSLARAMPDCSFKHHTRLSHEILALLRDRQIDLGVATRPPSDSDDLVEYPLLHDPFVLALPRTTGVEPEVYLNNQSPLPFLRYSQTQIIGRLIEAQLRRLHITLPNRFELDSNQSVMGMVAEGHGWAITTPSSFARAKRFRDRIALHPFPHRSFGRTLSLFATEVHVEPIAQLVTTQLRQLIRTRLVDPVLADHPWLGDSFHLMANPWDRT